MFSLFYSMAKIENREDFHHFEFSRHEVERSERDVNGCLMQSHEQHCYDEKKTLSL